MVHILLSMIVKNESRILERCIESCLPVIDGISICDTGSTDNTCEIIDRYVELKGGKRHNHVWKNFGHNRTMSFFACLDTARKMNLPLNETYGLLMDADMLLQVMPDFDKSVMKDPGYSITQTNPVITYYNCRLVRLDLPWRCIGVTHEYWGGDGCWTSKLETLKIDDRNDGGAKSDKFERDIRLLEQGIKDEPNNERYMFYLAQSYKDIGRFDDSITWYKKRIEAGKWEEEVFYAMFQIGRIYRDKGDEANMTMWYLKAWEFRPWRNESIYELSNWCRNNRKNNMAFMLAKQASQIPYPKDDLLFVMHDAYGVLPLIEMSICGFYNPRNRLEGFRASNELILRKDASQHVRQLTIGNILHYLEKLPAKETTLSMNAPVVRGNTSKRYQCLNPSIHWIGGKPVGNIRCVNYSQEKGNYTSFSTDKKIRTRNFFVQMDEEYNTKTSFEIVDNFKRTKREDCTILGFEDLRLFRFRDQWWAVVNSIEETGRPQQCLVSLKLDEALERYDTTHFVRMTHSGMTDIEKNWLPFVQEDKIHMIYHCHPFTVLEVDPDSGNCSVVSKKESQWNLSNFRGSGAPVRVGDKWWFVIHEVAFVNWRTYFHRVVEFNDNWEITRVSRPFFFSNKGVEFCLSVTLREDTLVFGCGIEDSSARVYEISTKDMEGQFDM